MGTIEKQQLLESLNYIEINRGATRPIKLDEILQRRLEEFLDRKLKMINGGVGTVSLRDL